MKSLLASLLLGALTLLDQQGLAEYGFMWWVAKPVITGAPCPECAAMVASPTNVPTAPEGVRVQ